MSFGCNLYVFSKKENSTARPTLEGNQGVHYEIDVKEPFSIITPQVVFTLDAGENPTQYNYAFIAQWNRRYYVEDWTNERGQWVASLRLDVLGTWKPEIGASSLYILRSSADYNGEIIDTMYPATTQDVLRISTGNDLFVDDMTSGCYVVGIIAKDTLGGGAVTYYAMTQAQFSAAINYLMGSVQWLNISSIEDNLQKALLNPIQYIASCQYFPFAYTGGTWVNNINMGWWDANIQGATPTDSVARRINTRNPVVTFTNRFTLDNHPQISRGEYLNFAPYCQMWLDFQPFGLIPLDVSQVRANGNQTLIAVIDVDMLSGVGSLRLISGSGESVGIIDHVQAKISFDVPIAQISVGSDGLGAALGVAGAAAAGSKIGAATGIISAITNLAIPKAGQVGSYTGAQSLLKGSPQLTTQYFTIVDEDNEHNGRPLCEYRTPASLGGFMIVERGDIAAPATKSELEQIRAYLESGFYYE